MSALAHTIVFDQIGHDPHAPSSYPPNLTPSEFFVVVSLDEKFLKRTYIVNVGWGNKKQQKH